ncbi:MAG TPA: hypothetical protein VLE97_09815 [Gaiellaceae bacterium]|nr:hypothetical protein [Gaiellaceae bacterium]
MTAKVDALSVACPQCGAPAGERCWSGTRRGRKLGRGSHGPRERLARGEAVSESFETFLRREISRVQGEVLSRKKP